MTKTIQINLDEYLNLKEFHDKVKYENAQMIDMSRFYSTSSVHYQQYLYISKDDFAKKYQKEFYDLQNENNNLIEKLNKLKKRNLFQRILNQNK
jgi:hypothetical protein